MEEVKKKVEVEIVNLIKKGLNPSKIAVHLNMSLPLISYYLASLKSQGIVKKVAYGTWEVDPIKEVKTLSHKGGKQVKIVRGHAFIWKVRPKRQFLWKDLLINKQINYDEVGLQGTPRVIINQRKVWLGKNYISIFEPSWSSFFATNPIESKKDAVISMIDIIDELKKVLNIEFKYEFTCKRQHYGFVDNPEAKFFISKGKRILIKNEKGFWFSIDYSKNMYKEAETISEKDADRHGIGYQNLMNSHERTDFKVTPEFTLKAMDGILKNQKIFDNNMKSHLEVLNRLGEAVKELSEKIKEFKK